MSIYASSSVSRLVMTAASGQTPLNTNDVYTIVAILRWRGSSIATNGWFNAGNVNYDTSTNRNYGAERHGSSSTGKGAIVARDDAGVSIVNVQSADTMPFQTWLAAAARRGGAADLSLKYKNPAAQAAGVWYAAASSSANIGTRTAPTWNSLLIDANSGAVEILALKAWQGVKLTDEELDQEFQYFLPQTNENSLWDAWDFTEVSGNGQYVGLVNGRIWTAENAIAAGTAAPSWHLGMDPVTAADRVAITVQPNESYIAGASVTVQVEKRNAANQVDPSPGGTARLFYKGVERDADAFIAGAASLVYTLVNPDDVGLDQTMEVTATTPAPNPEDPDIVLTPATTSQFDVAEPDPGEPPPDPGSAPTTTGRRTVTISLGEAGQSIIVTEMPVALTSGSGGLVVRYRASARGGWVSIPVVPLATDIAPWTLGGFRDIGYGELRIDVPDAMSADASGERDLTLVVEADDLPDPGYIAVTVQVRLARPEVLDTITGAVSAAEIAATLSAEEATNIANAAVASANAAASAAAAEAAAVATQEALDEMDVNIDLSPVTNAIASIAAESKQSVEFERAANSATGYFYPLNPDGTRDGTRRQITYAGPTSWQIIRIGPAIPVV